MAHLTITRLPYSNNLRLARMVEEGIHTFVVKDLAQVLGLSLPAIAGMMSIPPRTLERRIGENARLGRTESDRVVRLGRLYTKAVRTFEDTEAAVRWLREPLDTLAGSTPLQLIRTEPGSREVEQVLGRIEHGVF